MVLGPLFQLSIHFIHPSEHIRQKFPNPVAGQRLSDCHTIWQEMKKVTQKDQLVNVVHHEDFKTDAGDFIDLYVVKHYWKVQKAGDADLHFDAAPTNDGGGQGDKMVPLPAAVDEYINGEKVNTIEALQDVVDVNDDNEPAPENVPQRNDNNVAVFGEWGHTGFNGEVIIQHFQDKEVGATDTLPGVLDNVPVHVHCMKEPDYVMMLMSSYGTLSECGEEKK